MRPVDSGTVRRSRAAIFVVLGLIAAACAGTGAPKGGSDASPRKDSPPEKEGIFKLDHLIFIVQENRSFDHYFGTYPGADGIPKKVCVPDPQFDNRCTEPYHSTSLFNNGGPHGKPHSIVDVNNGKMDGFIRAAILGGDNYCLIHRTAEGCNRSLGPQGQPDVMSYHDRRGIPNYWEYADHFVLQDGMFASVDSWTLPAHLYLVSAWSAICSDIEDPMSCQNDSEMNPQKTPVKFGPDRKPPYAWA